MGYLCCSSCSLITLVVLDGSHTRSLHLLQGPERRGEAENRCNEAYPRWRSETDKSGQAGWGCTHSIIKYTSPTLLTSLKSFCRRTPNTSTWWRRSVIRFDCLYSVSVGRVSLSRCESEYCTDVVRSSIIINISSLSSNLPIPVQASSSGPGRIRDGEGRTTTPTASSWRARQVVDLCTRALRRIRGNLGCQYDGDDIDMLHPEGALLVMMKTDVNEQGMRRIQQWANNNL